MLPKSMRHLFESLQSKSTIIVDDDCHDTIIENITARSHLDYEEFFSSTEEDNECDSVSSDDDYV